MGNAIWKHVLFYSFQMFKQILTAVNYGQYFNHSFLEQVDNPIPVHNSFSEYFLNSFFTSSCLWVFKCVAFR